MYRLWLLLPQFRMFRKYIYDRDRVKLAVVWRIPKRECIFYSGPRVLAKGTTAKVITTAINPATKRLRHKPHYSVHFGGNGLTTPGPLLVPANLLDYAPRWWERLLHLFMFWKPYPA